MEGENGLIDRYVDSICLCVYVYAWQRKGGRCVPLVDIATERLVRRVCTEVRHTALDARLTEGCAR